jgi:hypothetical protein
MCYTYTGTDKGDNKMNAKEIKEFKEKMIEAIENITCIGN